MQLCGILAWMALTSVAASQDFCFDTWLTEPHTASANDCNILSGGPGVVRQSTCVVTLGNKDRTVQWYYTPTREDAGRNGTLVPSNVQNMSADVSAILNISDDTLPGYYWCEVEGTLPTGSVKNPSQVIYIDKPCNVSMYGPCSEFISASSPSQRCALGDEEEDLIIVDIQEITCPPSTEDDGTKPKDDEIIDTDKQPDTSKPETSEKDSSTNLQTIATSGAVSDGGVDSLPMEVIWMVVGLGIAVLLLIIAILLVILICLHCRKKRVKDDSGMPRQFVNQGYMTTELDLSTSIAASRTERPPEPGTTTTQHDHQGDGENHTYAEIPPNFTLSSNMASGEHSPVAAATIAAQRQQNDGRHDYIDRDDYEDIDNQDIVAIGRNRSLPTAAGNQQQSTAVLHQKHQYEAVIGEEGDEKDYSRLQRSSSKSRNFSTSTTPTADSAPSPAATGGSSSLSRQTPSGRDDDDAIIFDNPKYSQLGNYRSQDSLVADRSKKSVDVEQQLSTSGQGRGKGDYFHDSSAFVVLGLAEDETKRHAQNNLSTRPVATAATSNSSHYTPLIQSEVQKENSYSTPIVSSLEKYVSEHGHVYQILDGSDDKRQGSSLESEQNGAATNGGLVGRENYHTLESIACDSGIVTGHPAGESENDEDEGVYDDTIDMSIKALMNSRASPNNDLAYDVIDRRTSGTTPSRTSGTTPTPSSSHPPRKSSVDYDVFDRNDMSPGNVPPRHSNTNYDVIERSITPSSSKKNSLKNQEFDAGRGQTFPGKFSPSMYSSLELSTSEAKQNSFLQPDTLYHSLEQGEIETKQVEGYPFYNTLENDGVRGSGGVYLKDVYDTVN